ncbi:MAG: hypothetical protein QOE06_2737 [Thermoleophilaceae bacterium]|nr:hypothetical protein [Thermoleophilaceae bacterium]
MAAAAATAIRIAAARTGHAARARRAAARTPSPRRARRAGSARAAGSSAAR